jgi:hypothetical protein
MENANKEIIFLVEDSAEGGFQARALGHSIFTCGNSMEELKSMVRDAVKCHFDDDEMPKIIRLHLVRDEVMAL